MLNLSIHELVQRAYPLWWFLLAVAAGLLLCLLVFQGQRRQMRAAHAHLNSQLQLQMVALQSDYQHAVDNAVRLEQENERLYERVDFLLQQKSEVELALGRERARTEERELALAAQLSLLEDAKGGMAKEFENLANRLFEDKQQQFSRSSKSQIETVIDPFQRQLREFHQRVDDFHRQDIAQRHQLMGQITQLQKQSQRIGEDAVNLANALKGGNKLQGNWGELVLDRVLEQAGLVRGREFTTQASYVNAEGKRQQPDAIVFLPENKQIIIDAKVSLVAYERFANADVEAARCVALKEHIDSIRGHIKGLAAKSYADLPGINTLDFVCLFIPIEGAFIALAQQAPEVLQEAYDQKIILVSPSSLLLVLKTIDSLWQRERQDRNVELIVTNAGKLYDQFVRFVESMNEVGTSLEKARGSHQRAFARLSEGRGNIVKRAEELKQLGAKTARKLPAELVVDAEENHSQKREVQL